MNRISVEAQENKNIPQIGSNMSVEDRLKVLADLIVDRILDQEKQSEGLPKRI